MTLREWTSDAIRKGGTIQWALAMGWKFVIEGAIALILGYAGTSLILWIFPMVSIRQALGGSTFQGLWLILAIALFWRFTLCKYAPESATSE